MRAPLRAGRQARLLVLLLPEELEAFELRPLAEDLLRAPGVVAVDPPRASYHSLSRIPDPIGVTIAAKQARRLRRRLPGAIGALAIFHPGQYPLARALLAQSPGAELWYGRLWSPETGDRRAHRLRELDLMAAERSALTFEGADATPLWERLAALEATA